MKICVVGGIFDKPQDYRNKHMNTPETTLVSGLQERGIVAEGIGHLSFRSSTAESFDLVHVHHVADGAIRMIGSRLPFVFTAHSGPMIHGYKKSMFSQLLFKYILRHCDGLVSLSARETAFFLSQVGKRSDSIKIAEIPNGIKTDLFFPKNSSIHDDNGVVHLLFVGQLAPVKGVQHLIEAVKILESRYNLILTLVYQTDSLEDNYRQMVAELSLQERVVFHGFASHLQLPDIYNAADLLVLPSYAEALPSVISEALMCGLPVVATDVGGVKDQVGTYGVVVRPGDSQEIASGIVQAIERLGYFRRIKHEMSNYATNRFSIDTMLDKHIALYQEILKSQPIRPFSTILQGGLLNTIMEIYRWNKN